MRKKRYFETVDKKTLRDIASKGGKKIHELGVAHHFTKEEARIAGLKGLSIRWGGNVLSKEQMDNSEKASV